MYNLMTINNHFFFNSAHGNLTLVTDNQCQFLSLVGTTCLSPIFFNFVEVKRFKINVPQCPQKLEEKNAHICILQKMLFPAVGRLKFSKTILFGKFRHGYFFHCSDFGTSRHQIWNVCQERSD